MIKDINIGFVSGKVDQIGNEFSNNGSYMIDVIVASSTTKNGSAAVNLVPVTIFSKKPIELDCKVGDDVFVTYKLASRENQGKFYLKAWMNTIKVYSNNNNTSSDKKGVDEDVPF